MSRARFVAAARQEFLAEIDYYDNQQAGLGARFLAAVEEATSRALTFPNAGSAVTGSTRRVLVRGFPFALVYRPDPEKITVFALAHHARRPGYWRLRITQSRK